MGDKVLIMGSDIGVVEKTIDVLHVNDRGEQSRAEKGDLCAFQLDTPIKKSDKLYKVVATDE